MRRLPLLILPFIFPACAPMPQRTPSAPPAAAAATDASPDTPSPAPTLARTPSTPAAAPLFTSQSIAGVTFQGVSFDSRTHRLVVIDQPAGPASIHATAADAGSRSGGIAAVNGGFFTPEGQALGLVIARGKPSGAWNSASSLGSGLWFEDSAGNPTITRRSTIGKSSAMKSTELLQSGPLLIEHRRPVSALEATKTSARTFILWDGGSRWWIGCSSPCSLATLADLLSSSSPSGWKVLHALNLDGGRSSDLWVSAAVSGGPAERRPIWNRPVRNFLVLKNR